jgi:hypothetical protein
MYIYVKLITIEVDAIKNKNNKPCIDRKFKIEKSV